MATWHDGLRALGSAIRTQRVAADLTQSELGDRAGIGGKYVSEIERGTRDLPYSTLHGIVEHGLDLRLEIQCRGRGAVTNGPSALPRNIAQVAREIAELPADQRDAVLSLVRAALRLAND